ncbi:hypothetical protein Tco_0819180 [Tanacetum coccineum]|uniref:Uncharacterized protein n=1 Tax=Tanacetum coccineum TaxID=301880 RepID=A0ABQ5A5S3_9ASTR
MISKINLLWKTVSEKLDDTPIHNTAGSPAAQMNFTSMKDPIKEELQGKGIKSPSKLLSPKYLSQSSLAEQNRNPSSPKHVHFVNSIVILNKEDEAKEEGNVNSSTTKYKDREIIVESEEEFEKETEEEIKEEEEDSPIKGLKVFVGNFTYDCDFVVLEDTTSVIDHDLGSFIFGKPFVEATELVYDKEEGTITFEKDKEKIVFKMPHKMDIEDDYDKGYRKPSDLEDGFYRDTIKLGPEYVTRIADEGEVTLLICFVGEWILRHTLFVRNVGRFEVIRTTERAARIDVEADAVIGIGIGKKSGTEITIITDPNMGMRGLGVGIGEFGAEIRIGKKDAIEKDRTRLRGFYHGSHILPNAALEENDWTFFALRSSKACLQMLDRSLSESLWLLSVMIQPMQKSRLTEDALGDHICRSISEVVRDVPKASTLLPAYFEGVKRVINAVSIIIGPNEGDTPDRAKYSQGIIGCECEHPKRGDTDLNSRHKRHLKSGAARRAAVTANIPVVNVGAAPRQHPTKEVELLEEMYGSLKGVLRCAVTILVRLSNGELSIKTIIEGPSKILWGHEEESTVKRKDKIADLEHAVKAKGSNKEVNGIMIDKEKKMVHMDHDNYDRHRHAVEIVEDTPLHHWFNDSLEDNMEIQSSQNNVPFPFLFIGSFFGVVLKDITSCGKREVDVVGDAW